MLFAWRSSLHGSRIALTDRVDSLVAAGVLREPVGRRAARARAARRRARARARSDGRSSRATAGCPSTEEELAWARGVARGNGRRGALVTPAQGEVWWAEGRSQATSRARGHQNRRDRDAREDHRCAGDEASPWAADRDPSSTTTTASVRRARRRSTTSCGLVPTSVAHVEDRRGKPVRGAWRSAARSPRSPTADRRCPTEVGHPAPSGYRESSRRALKGSLATGSPNA